jgi:cobalamin biosynthetic protein CobC|tara:strand:+ start:638 stop:1696 length:1059 start_codon:yes stop_codon:yes gene_type:complete
MSPLFHGGDLRSASAVYGRDPADWLDLSTGINQHSYPVPAIGQDAWHQLPYLNPALINAAKCYYGDHPCLASSGSQNVIQLLPFLLHQLGNHQAAWVPDVGYQEHRHAWSQQGEVCTYSGLNSQLAAQQIDKALQDDELGHLVIINPNNPTGQMFSRQQLMMWAHSLDSIGGFLVVDEAFIDTSPAASLLSAELADNLIILRSVGKFFGLAGIRLGFTFAAQTLLNRLATELGPWSVNGPAQTVAIAALSDTVWQTNMRSQLVNEGAQQLDIWQASMARLGADLTASHALFRSFIMASDLADKLHHSAAKSGLLLRPVNINSDTSLLRIGNIDLGHSSALEHCQTWIQQESK